MKKQQGRKNTDENEWETLNENKECRHTRNQRQKL